MTKRHDSATPAAPPKTTGPHRFEMDRWISCAPFEKLLHMDIIEAADGRAILQMPFHIEFAQGAGLMHGGALVGLADTAVVMAIKSIVPPQTHFATVAMTTKYLRPVREGIIEARAQVATAGERTLEGQAKVYDHLERPVLDFDATFKIARDAQIRPVKWGDAPHPTKSQGG